ncbi:hypothetical protein FGO68_gene9312 [Halteria grandinella]|uniref:Uncharacterized protein n=1 Tax=Halteria grandinella TaxID=5974 RepID=A0A8J8NJH5_HALGN|nr:hypothetical protein FGO68_gene9312 [Halteria grandinella]
MNQPLIYFINSKRQIKSKCLENLNKILPYSSFLRQLHFRGLIVFSAEFLNYSLKSVSIIKICPVVQKLFKAILQCLREMINRLQISLEYQLLSNPQGMLAQKHTFHALILETLLGHS